MPKAADAVLRGIGFSEERWLHDMRALGLPADALSSAFELAARLHAERVGNASAHTLRALLDRNGSLLDTCLAALATALNTAVSVRLVSLHDTTARWSDIADDMERRAAQAEALAARIEREQADQGRVSPESQARANALATIQDTLEMREQLNRHQERLPDLILLNTKELADGFRCLVARDSHEIDRLKEVLLGVLKLLADLTPLGLIAKIDDVRTIVQSSVQRMPPNLRITDGSLAYEEARTANLKAFCTVAETYTSIWAKARDALLTKITWPQQP